MRPTPRQVGYDSQEFVQGCRELKVTPHVAAKKAHSAIAGRTTRHASYKSSLRVRKRIEESFGWIKTVGGLAKTKLTGHAKLSGQVLLCFAAYNLVRMGPDQWLVGCASCMRPKAVVRQKWVEKVENDAAIGKNGIRSRTVGAFFQRPVKQTLQNHLPRPS